MSIPTHKLSCYTKAFRTECPDCKDSVWFFSCTCGSKVYFDDLGWPWNPHHCKKYAIREAIEMIRNFERYTDEEIYQVIEAYRKKHSKEITDEIWEILEYELGKRRYKFTVKEIGCDPSIDMLSGQVLEINTRINLYKRFGLKESSVFAKGLLGKLSNAEYDEITIRENPNKDNQSRQYKAFIKHTLAKKNNLKKGDKILALVSVINITSTFIWEIADIKQYY